MRLVLLGLPGAGKGTQAKRIAEKYHLTAISTGEMLREAAKEKDTFGLRVQEYMNKGELVPDEWINSLVKSRLQEKDVENGFVLDGYPRTLQQAKVLEAYLQSQNQNLDAVFFLDVSQDTLRHRLAQRGNLRSKEKQGNSQIEAKEVDFTVDQEGATLWFHSHAHQKSAEQVYNGLSGLIFVEDEHSDSLDLPKEYGVNDFLLILQERFFDEDNQFNYDTVYNFDGTTGDTPLVNRTIRPYIEVGQDWVRLRVVNGSNARNYQLRLSDESFFYQIATDGGFLETPVERKEFLLSPGERAEIVVDMSKYKVGEEVSLVDISTTEILALQITGDKSGSLKPLPEKLNDLPPVEADSLPDRQIEMSGMGHMLTLKCLTTFIGHYSKSQTQESTKDLKSVLCLSDVNYFSFLLF